MAGNVDTDKYYVEKEEIAIDSDDEFQYEEVPIDDDVVPSELEEDLDAAVRTIRESHEDTDAKILREPVAKACVVQKPEVVDDFVRNFLIHMGLKRSLDCFQTEWYELQEKGQLKYSEVGTVPDVYTRNQDMENEIDFLKKEADKYRGAALKAKETYVKLRKERDFHRMHHKRVVQEKNKLIDDIKKLKRHYGQYAPNMDALKSRYEAAMKEKMLANLERDRAVGQVTGLQSTLKSMEGFTGGTGLSCPSGKENKGPTQATLHAERQKKANAGNGDVAALPADFKRHPNDSEFPKDTGVNPYLNQVKVQQGHGNRGLRLSNTFSAATLSVSGKEKRNGSLYFAAHGKFQTNDITYVDEKQNLFAVSGVSLHPTKQLLATASDDHTWKVWAVPGGEIIMTGEGHSDWVSDCEFHPTGTRLATTSGDSTVKVWDFSRAACIHTFTDHTAAVWSCSWHTCGDFLATSSMDNSAKVWDINSLRCRYTLRGHTDSVNTIEFLPFSNNLLSSSADKTVSLWDARNGLCAQTFYGHLHSVNHATFNLRGDMIASCDSYGCARLWDVRMVAPMASFDLGPHPANKLAFDPSGAVIAIASNDSTIKVYELATGQVQSLAGHEDAVQCLVFDRSGDFMISGGSDATIRTWS